MAVPMAGLLAACAATGPDAAQDGASAYSGPVTYRCEEALEMTLERKGTLVSIRSPRGVDVELPAAPPGQSARYGESLYAVVLDGDDALWMVNGKAPIACKR